MTKESSYLLNKSFDDKNIKMYGENDHNDNDSLREKLNPNATPSSLSPTRPTVKQMLRHDFYQRSNWVEELCEGLFKVHIRGSTIKAEIYYVSDVCVILYLRNC